MWRNAWKMAWVNRIPNPTSVKRRKRPLQKHCQSQPVATLPCRTSTSVQSSQTQRGMAPLSMIEMKEWVVPVNGFSGEIAFGGVMDLTNVAASMKHPVAFFQ